VTGFVVSTGVVVETPVGTIGSLEGDGDGDARDGDRVGEPLSEFGDGEGAFGGWPLAYESIVTMLERLHNKSMIRSSILWIVPEPVECKVDNIGGVFLWAVGKDFSEGLVVISTTKEDALVARGGAIATGAFEGV
jgi:hypothetical protein